LADPLPTPPRVRFAPAPTGQLHLGSARTALFNWLYARRHGGTFILRIEDTDLERSRPDLIAQVLEALRWLTLDWDEGPDVGGPHAPYIQSERRLTHVAAARRLIEAGRAFACYVSADELEARRRAALAAGRPFRYEGWHRELSAEDRRRFEAEGRRPVIRLRVDPPPEGFVVQDLIKGPTHFPPDQIDDFVILRSDGTPSFHLANVLDDAAMNITHVIRGEDHLTNTVRHLALLQALELTPPRYAHLPMILGPDRTKLSKRHGAVSVTELRDKGYLPEALISLLALLGWSPGSEEERLTREQLIRRFDLDRCGRSGSIFDLAKLDHFNGLAIRELPLEELDRRLEPFTRDLPSLDPARRRDFVALLQDGLERLADFAPAARRLLDPPVYDDALFQDRALEGADGLLQALSLRWQTRQGPLTAAEVKADLAAQGRETGRKGRNLYFPLRAVLTGADHGPPLDAVAAALGRPTCLERLAQFRAALERRRREGRLESPPQAG